MSIWCRILCRYLQYPEVVVSICSTYCSQTNIQADPFEMSQKKRKRAEKNPLYYVIWTHVAVLSDNPLARNVWDAFLGWQAAQQLRRLWIMVGRITSACVRHIVRPLSRNMLYHFTMPRCQGTWWQLYWRKSSLGLCNTRKFRIPHDAVCLLLGCDRHVCFSFASVATWPLVWTVCKPSIQPTRTFFPFVFKQNAQRYAY
jgi:hypothetical protein